MKTENKKISVVIPCYNDEKSIQEMYDRLIRVFQNLPAYDYEIIFVDDCSPDDTWKQIASVCTADKKVKGVHNITNFGPARNIFNALRYGTGDATFLLMGDLEQPPEMLPEFLQHWESGYNAVVGITETTGDHGILLLGRKMYYGLINHFSHSRIIQNFSYCGVYDAAFIHAIQRVKNIQPYFPGLLSEYGGKIKALSMPREESKRGRSNQNFMMKYDQAMIGLTSYTKTLMRIATFAGCFIGVMAIALAIFFLVMKLLRWNDYPMGIPAILVGVFTLSAVQLFFMGILGEYVLSINERSMDRPITVTDQMLNFQEGNSK